jgi:hypothetical protein
MATNGITLITPTSVAVTGAGSSATINAGGSVTFATAETLSLNGVFSSLYDNYIIDVRQLGTFDTGGAMRLRASGTDEASASNYYTTQYIVASATTIAAARTTSNARFLMSVMTNGGYGGSQVFIYGPNLAQPTAMRDVGSGAISSAYLQDHAGTHSLSTAYDGFTYIAPSGSVSGLIKVYGLVQ